MVTYGWFQLENIEDELQGTVKFPTALGMCTVGDDLYITSEQDQHLYLTTNRGKEITQEREREKKKEIGNETERERKKIRGWQWNRHKKKEEKW